MRLKKYRSINHRPVRGFNRDSCERCSSFDQYTAGVYHLYRVDRSLAFLPAKRDIVAIRAAPLARRGERYIAG